MRAVKLHVWGEHHDGFWPRRTFLIREDRDGEVDIVEECAPRCDADRSVAVDETVERLEVERVDDRVL